MDSPEKRIAEAAGITWTKAGFFWDPSTTAGAFFGGVVKCVDQSRWKKAKELLDELYKLVGATNDYTKDAIRKGKHPLQMYMKSMEKQYMA
jgi:hypothetical protein